MKWPLPGSYNILLMAIAIILRQKLQYVGIVALFSGIIAIYYGANAYIDGMAKTPIAMPGLYIAFGLTGIFTFPATLIYDEFPVKDKSSVLWTVILVIFWIGLIVSSVLAAFTAIEAVPQHLLAPP